MIPLEPMSPVHSTDLLNKLLDEKCNRIYRNDAKKGGDKYGSWVHAFPQFLCAAPFPGDKTQYSKRDKLGFRR